jgi:glycosyltransferase involved in cell wall biosynthesis
MNEVAGKDVNVPASGKVSVVIPAFNEARVIGRVVADVRREGYPVILVDDGSSDDTGAVAAAAGAFVVRHPINLGQGAALQTGIDHALTRQPDVIVTFDADGQHRPGEIGRLVEALARERADFALGNRFLGQTTNLPLLRKLLLRAAIIFTRITCGIRVSDTHNGFRAMTQRGARAIRLRQNRMAHASEVLQQIASSKLPYVEVPVSIDYTAYSLNKGQRVGDAMNILLDLFTRTLYR